MTENAISGLVPADDDTPDQPMELESAPEVAEDSPLGGSEASDTSETATASAPTTAPTTTQNTMVVKEPEPAAGINTQQVDKIMNALLGQIGDHIGVGSSCKVVIYSDPGQGKSSILGTAPNCLAYDFEDGLLAAAESPYGIAPNIRPLPYVNFKQAEALLDKFEEKNPALDWVDVFAIDTYSDFVKRTLAGLVEKDWRSAPSMFSRYEPQTKHYTENNEMHDRFVRRLRDLTVDLLILTHAKTVEPKNKPAKTYPDFSESFANRLEAKMDVVGYLQMQEHNNVPTPTMITKSTTMDLIHCKRRVDLPDTMYSPTWPDIKAGWQRTQDKIAAMYNG